MNMAWTDERVALLKKLWTEGHSASQIASQLGGVTRNAVIGKVHRLGLSGRATPSRPVKKPPRLARPKPPRQKVAAQVAVADPKAAPVRTAAVAQAEKDAAAHLPPAILEDGSTASILNIRDSMCKWPIGDPADASFAFCGRKAEGGVYCAEHAKVAFQPAKKRERKKEDFDYVRKIAG